MNRSIAVLLFAVMVGCGGSSSPSAPSTPPPPPAPTRSQISITITPDPIIATPTGDSQFPWTMTYSIRVSETAGLAANINQVIRTYKDKATNLEIVTGTSNPAEITTRAGTNLIPASGSLNIGSFELTYRGSNNGRQLVLTITVEVIDGLGNRFSTSKNVEVL